MIPVLNARKSYRLVGGELRTKTFSKKRRHMRSRWFIIDTRFLSISFTIENADFSLDDLNPLNDFIFDVSLRPIATLHISSVWTTYNRCVNFAILFTSFQSFGYQSDIFETDEMFHYPTPGHTPTLEFLGHCWDVIAIMLMRKWFCLSDRLVEFRDFVTALIKKRLQPPTG